MPRPVVLTACAVAAAIGVSVPLAVAAQDGQPARSTRRAYTVPSSLPGLSSSPKADVIALALPGLHPARSRVDRVTGPFDERFTLTGLALRGDVVSGALTVTSDVSEIIDLQVLVGFYDAAGHFLGSATYEKHGEDVSDTEEHVAFRVSPPPAVAGRVASAAVGVPVLVNE